MFRLGGNLSSEASVVVGRKGVAKDLHVGPVVETGYTLHEVGGRVVAEIGGEIADSQSTATGL